MIYCIGSRCRRIAVLNRKVSITTAENPAVLTCSRANLSHNLRGSRCQLDFSVIDIMYSKYFLYYFRHISGTLWCQSTRMKNCISTPMT